MTSQSEKNSGIYLELENTLRDTCAFASLLVDSCRKMIHDGTVNSMSELERCKLYAAMCGTEDNAAKLLEIYDQTD